MPKITILLGFHIDLLQSLRVQVGDGVLGSPLKLEGVIVINKDVKKLEVWQYYYVVSTSFMIAGVSWVNFDYPTTTNLFIIAFYFWYLTISHKCSCLSL